MSDELSAKLKVAVVEQELMQTKAEMYRLGLRHVVQEKLGKKDQCLAIEQDMENIQAAVQFYEEELKKILEEENAGGGNDQADINPE